MINKKNVLGKHPEELGVKDAIHTAIVSVRAGACVQPGQRCGLNEFNEAVPNPKGPGVADPFLRSPVTRGESFWLLLDQDSVPNVQHVWEHPTVNFAPPTREAQQNKWLAKYADALGVTYQQLMAACDHVVKTDTAAKYPGTKAADELDKALDEEVDMYEVWSEWAGESGHEFANHGSACCPEYAYPEVLFMDVY